MIEVDESQTQRNIINHIITFDDLSKLTVSQLDRNTLQTLVFAACLLGADGKGERLEAAKNAMRYLEDSIRSNLEREIALIDLAQSSEIGTSTLIKKLSEIIVCKSSGAHRGLSTSSLIDHCSICDQSLMWDSLIGACCASGHLFGT